MENVIIIKSSTMNVLCYFETKNLKIIKKLENAL